MSEFFLDDGLNGVFDLTPSVVMESLKIEQLIRILTALGVTNIIEQDNQLILPTVCHNHLDDNEMSHKLYYYYDSKLFTCYTECSKSFNIFELVRKVHAINDHPINFYEAFSYVLSFFGTIGHSVIQPTHNPIGNRYARRLSVEDLPEYNKNALSIFPAVPTVEWLQEGISAEAMKLFDIRFSPSRLKIIIPHYDIKGRLIGIRGRALDEYEIENYGKYMPVKIENTFHTHHLSRNLYGIFTNQSAIRRQSRAVLFEGEKSCLRWRTTSAMIVWLSQYAVTISTKSKLTCWSKNWEYQKSLLLLIKSMKGLFSPEAEAYKYKLIALCRKYNSYANFSFIYDMEGLLDIKDAPVDKGKEIYERLYDNRVKIR